MGSCCTTDTSALPDKPYRNTDSISKMQESLMNNAHPKSDEYTGEELKLNRQELVQYILKISPSELHHVWKRIDDDLSDTIQIERDLPRLFLAFIDNYILRSSASHSATKHEQKANSLATQLSDYFQSILENYDYNEGDTMSKGFYLQHIKQYFRDPNPGTI